jgi:hypothetical protein
VARSAIRAEQRAPTRSRCGEPGEHCEHGRPKAALDAAEHEPIVTKPGTAPNIRRAKRRQRRSREVDGEVEGEGEGEGDGDVDGDGEGDVDGDGEVEGEGEGEVEVEGEGEGEGEGEIEVEGEVKAEAEASVAKNERPLLPAFVFATDERACAPTRHLSSKRSAQAAAREEHVEAAAATEANADGELEGAEEEAHVALSTDVEGHEVLGEEGAEHDLERRLATHRRVAAEVRRCAETGASRAGHTRKQVLGAAEPEEEGRCGGRLPLHLLVDAQVGNVAAIER